jgi:hypothetical protein
MLEYLYGCLWAMQVNAEEMTRKLMGQKGSLLCSYQSYQPKWKHVKRSKVAYA